MQQNTGFIKTVKTRERVYQGPKGKEERHGWQRTDKRKAYE